MAGERLATVLLSMADAVLVVDDDGRIVATNDAYDEAFGDADSLRLTDEYGARIPDDETPWARAARGETFRTSFVVHGTGDEARWFEANGRPIPGSAGGVVVLRDISDRSHHRMQGEFIATLSHELRTPLTGLTAYLELLQRRLAKVGDATDNRYIDRAVAQARRFGQLVDELFDANRLAGGRLRYDMELLDLSSLVEEAVALISAANEDRDISMHTEGSPILVRADAHRLQQVVFNLVSNALRHAPDSTVAIALRRREGNAELTVQDWGPGIRPDEVEQIFERLHSDPDSPGLGLGLYLARGIVEGHGGSISVESSPGETTVFSVRLPLDEADGSPSD